MFAHFHGLNLLFSDHISTHVVFGITRTLMHKEINRNGASRYLHVTLNISSYYFYIYIIKKYN